MKLKIVTIAVIGVTLAACSKKEPEPVYVQPTFDKYGEATCPAGYTVGVLQDSGATVCSPSDVYVVDER